MLSIKHKKVTLHKADFILYVMYVKLRCQRNNEKKKNMLQEFMGEKHTKERSMKLLYSQNRQRYRKTDGQTER